MEEGEGGGERVAQGMGRCSSPAPPSQPFPATASAEGRQFNGAPSPARGEGEQEDIHFEKSSYVPSMPSRWGEPPCHGQMTRNSVPPDHQRQNGPSRFMYRMFKRCPQEAVGAPLQLQKTTPVVIMLILTSSNVVVNT